MTVEPGQPAPDFALRDQHGQSVSLSLYADRADVVLVFYPYAFSGVCSTELSAIRDRLDELVDDRTAVLGISCDPMFALRAYADRDGLGFPLLSDFWPHGEVARAYGVFDEVLGCARRSSFVVDRAGLVRWVVHNPMGEARDIDAYRAAIAAAR